MSGGPECITKETSEYDSYLLQRSDNFDKKNSNLTFIKEQLPSLKEDPELCIVSQNFPELFTSRTSTFLTTPDAGLNTSNLITGNLRQFSDNVDQNLFISTWIKIISFLDVRVMFSVHVFHV